MRLNCNRLWAIVLAAGEGTRVRSFLAKLCGGRGIKQFCAVIGRRSMLEHTLARVESLISRNRILVVVSSDHREEAEEQLGHWPQENVIYQPANRDTLPGILLPLAHVSRRDPSATVAIFPSDHFVANEGKFMETVERAASATRRYPGNMIFLGMTPNRPEDSYGWIEPASGDEDQETHPVRRFWEKPPASLAESLMARGALWNTLVFAANADTLWGMTRQVAPDIHMTFDHLRLIADTAQAPLFTERVYKIMRSLNVSSDLCRPLAARLRVLTAPDVGWCDWGSVERILASLRELGKLDDCLERLRRRAVDSNAHKLTVAAPMKTAAESKPPARQAGYSLSAHEKRLPNPVQRRGATLYKGEF